MMRLASATFRRRAGFTLVEILLAMLVFAVAITTILALLARSIETVDEIIQKDEAMRLSGALEDDLQSRPFNQSYAVVQVNQATPSNPSVFIALHLRVDPVTLAPRASKDGVQGVDYLILPRVYAGTDPLVSLPSSPANLAREGRLYKVLLTVSTANPATQAPNPPNLPGDPNTYTSAVLVANAKFYAVGAPTSPLTNLSPVYEYNLAVRR